MIIQYVVIMDATETNNGFSVAHGPFESSEEAEQWAKQHAIELAIKNDELEDSYQVFDLINPRG